MRERIRVSGVRRSCAMSSVTWRMPASSRSIRSSIALRLCGQLVELVAVSLTSMRRLRSPAMIRRSSG